MDAPFEYVFPAIRGLQAGREYYVSMCPLRLLPKIFLFNEEELVPELRAQRQLNRGRLPEIARYIVENKDSYVFSAITASVDADIRFAAAENLGEQGLVGLLHIPMNARFIINDGQHRRAAIESALRDAPELANESIAVVLFHDKGLERCQQMFADLNRYAVRPARSLSVLYDHRDDQAQLAKLVISRLPSFRGLVEMERSTLSARSRRLFTLSAIYTATATLLTGLPEGDPDSRAGYAAAFWSAVADQFPEWAAVRDGSLTSGEVRETFIHTHGVVLHALGRVGNGLLPGTKARTGDDWTDRLGGLRQIDWRRTNPAWEGRTTIGGRVSKSFQNVILTGNAIKLRLGLPLGSEEQRLEDAHARGADAAA
ncbi:DNA sulfur modification protein DndB [Methylobacterium oryzihabitans]|uniref:DNA sulfur modification protein DndB n=1 Tax=Methylobacterium oryzihabitans TaxID=2499852 RepID=A0A437P8D0_9HYPH|nr:DNA sulfur modification protein DndB [Methylobacterium oryzihabitans]RVU18489.1 DNA sulfur modification protein DndB [Methylobacterium oryzihabitans]